MTAARTRGRKLPPTGLQWRLDMSEAELESAVVDLSKPLGLHTMHIRKARKLDDKTGRQRWVTPVAGDGIGWPDWAIFGQRLRRIDPVAAVFWELKDKTGVVTPEQEAWIEWLCLAGLDAAVRRPEHLISGQIEDELKALSAKARRADAARRGIPLSQFDLLTPSAVKP